MSRTSYQITKQNVSLHIRHILADGEHSRTATVKEYLTVQTEGTRTKPFLLRTRIARLLWKS